MVWTLRENKGAGAGEGRCALRVLWWRDLPRAENKRASFEAAVTTATATVAAVEAAADDRARQSPLSGRC